MFQKNEAGEMFNFAIALLLIILCLPGCSSHPFCRSYDDIRLLHSYQPKCGTFVRHPSESLLLYYYVSQSDMNRSLAGSGPTASPGLWVSHDNGVLWLTTSRLPDLAELSIHSKTGNLFAMMIDSQITKTEDGMLVVSYSPMLITSQDEGRNWRDITPSGVVHKSLLVHFFEDPDDPARMCFLQLQPSRAYYQPTDDRHSAWRKYTENEWSQTHDGWQWQDAYPGRETYRSVSFPEVFSGPDGKPVMVSPEQNKKRE